MKKTIYRAFLILCVCCLLLPPFVYADNMQLEVKQTGADFASLAWDAVDQADGYAVFRGENGGALSLVKCVNGCTTRNYGLKNGMQYVYCVRPYVLDDSGARVYCGTSNRVSIQIGVMQPQITGARLNSGTSLCLFWQGDPCADSYSVYRSSDGVNWKLIKRVEDTSTVCYGLVNGQKYYFRVRANRVICDVERYSAYSEVYSCIAGVEAPQGITALRITPQSADISWEPVQHATAYRLYRAAGDGAFSLVKTVYGTETSNYGLKENESYTYRVAAICKTDSGIVRSAYSVACEAKPVVAQVQNLRIRYRGTGSTALCWDAAANAAAYRLYRADGTQEEKLIKTVCGLTTENYGLVDGGLYTYRVRGISEDAQRTASGRCSEVVAYFHKQPPCVRWSQEQVNECTLSWTAVDGADSYRVYAVENGTYRRLDETQAESVSIPLPASQSTFAVSAVKMGYETERREVQLLAAWEKNTRTFSAAKAEDETSVRFAWQQDACADGYELQRKVSGAAAYESLGIISGTSFVDASVSSATNYIYRYRAHYAVGTNRFFGAWSEPVEISVPNAPVYRALLIGEYNYAEKLNGTDNDLQAMGNMLAGLTAMGWETTSRLDASKAEIVHLMDTAFDGAGEDDVSLFYYSGHGVVGSGDYYSGALVTVDNAYLPLEQLAELLSAVPGKVVVILDSCGSGAAIYEKGLRSHADKTFQPEQFNQMVVGCFSAREANHMLKSGLKSGEFRQSKFYVLTASAYEETSRTVYKNKMWGGVMTRGLTDSVGYVYEKQCWLDTMNGDVNHDRIVTLNECYQHCADAASEYQHVQVYPVGSSFRLFYR